MNKSLLVLALSLSSVAAFADAYDCELAPGNYDGFGEKFVATVTARAIKLSNFEIDYVRGAKGKLDKTYDPRPQNAGSIRFLADVDVIAGGTGCDRAQIFLNKSMANGGNGRLTIGYECDAEGTGPIFMNYNCKL